jgi:hypothetical protein
MQPKSPGQARFSRAFQLRVLHRIVRRIRHLSVERPMLYGADQADLNWWARDYTYD